MRRLYEGGHRRDSWALVCHVPECLFLKNASGGEVGHLESRPANVLYPSCLGAEYIRLLLRFKSKYLFGKPDLLNQAKGWLPAAQCATSKAGCRYAPSCLGIASAFGLGFFPDLYLSDVFYLNTKGHRPFVFKKSGVQGPGPWPPEACFFVCLQRHCGHGVLFCFWTRGIK